MARAKKQIGGRKESPLVGGGSNHVEIQSPYERTYIPEDAEYSRYTELLRGFFKKFTRWQTILAADEYRERGVFSSGNWSGFSLLRSANGISITSGTSMKMDDPPDKVLQVRKNTYLDKPQYGLFGEKFIIRSGPAGRHLLLDPEDGMPLDQVTIDVGSQAHASWKGIKIITERPEDNAEGNHFFTYRQANYDLRVNTLTVKHKHVGNGVLTDEMAASLINTIDTLIPGSTSPTHQPDRRTRQETQIPKALLPASGRPPGRRA